jgi:threonine/homoserine/homoserine lactone efflux protein
MHMGLSHQSIFEFLIASLFIELTPGPNMAYLAAVGLRQGRRAGYFAVVGIGLGHVVVGVITSIGLSQLIIQVPSLYTALRWSGVVYLCYLAWEAWQNADDQGGDVAQSGRDYMVKGFVTNILNPKLYIFYISVLPTFVDLKSNIATQIATLTMIYVFTATAVHFSIVAAAGVLQPFFVEGKIRTYSAKLFALALLMIAGWVALGA